MLASKKSRKGRLAICTALVISLVFVIPMGISGLFAAADANGTDSPILKATAPALDNNVYAASKVSVKFNANGGKGSKTKKVTKGKKIGKLPAKPTRKNWVFNGWYTNAKGGVKVTITKNTKFSKSVTYYAQWIGKPFKASLTLNGGSGVKSSTTVRYGSAIPKPYKTGYVFAGWYTKNTGGSKVTYMPAKNIKLYARWATDRFSLGFDSNGGNYVGPRLVYYGSAYGTLPTPGRTGHSFRGWYTASTGGAKVATTTKMAAQNTTVYAQWNVNNYTLSFNSNGGTAVAAKVVPYGGQYGTLPTPTRTGYTFNGWFTAASGGAKVAPTTTMAAANTAVFAQWVQQEKYHLEVIGGIGTGDYAPGEQVYIEPQLPTPESNFVVWQYHHAPLPNELDVARFSLYEQIDALSYNFGPLQGIGYFTMPPFDLQLEAIYNY